MRVRVRLFAMQREAAGTRELAVELADGASLEDAWLAADFPLEQAALATIADQAVSRVSRDRA